MPCNTNPCDGPSDRWYAGISSGGFNPLDGAGECPVQEVAGLIFRRELRFPVSGRANGAARNGFQCQDSIPGWERPAGRRSSLDCLRRIGQSKRMHCTTGDNPPGARVAQSQALHCGGRIPGLCWLGSCPLSLSRVIVSGGLVLVVSHGRFHGSAFHRLWDSGLRRSELETPAPRSRRRELLG